MRTLTRLSRVAALPLAATLLVACGGGSDDETASEGETSSPSAEESPTSGDADAQTEAYCEDLQEAQDQFAAFGSGAADGEQLDQAFDTFQELAEVAPPEVSGQWQTLSGAFGDLQAALDEAGIELDDLTGLQTGELPEGTTQEDLQPVLAAVQGLSAPENAEASQAISTHAQETCGVDLSGGGAGGGAEGPTDAPTESPTE